MGSPQYAKDKPEDCEWCYWWGGKKGGCIRKECFYLLPEGQEDIKEQKTGDCDFCPYGKYFPCIGYCMVKLLMEMKKQ